ncbi:hypothetical protein F4803DRAFT_541646 [Xylaria telfairii]|nr:hypothetical protein F4803DRAFT_541646 [Xylaria telfairii]
MKHVDYSDCPRLFISTLYRVYCCEEHTVAEAYKATALRYQRTWLELLVLGFSGDDLLQAMGNICLMMAAVCPCFSLRRLLQRAIVLLRPPQSTEYICRTFIEYPPNLSSDVCQYRPPTSSTRPSCKYVHTYIHTYSTQGSTTMCCTPTIDSLQPFHQPHGHRMNPAEKNSSPGGTIANRTDAVSGPQCKGFTKGIVTLPHVLCIVRIYNCGRDIEEGYNDYLLSLPGHSSCDYDGPSTHCLVSRSAGWRVQNFQNKISWPLSYFTYTSLPG